MKGINTVSSQDTIRGTMLSIPDRPVRGFITYDARDPDSTFPPIEDLRPPEGVPGVTVQFYVPKAQALDGRWVPSAVKNVSKKEEIV